MKTAQEIAQTVKNPADEWRNRKLNKMALGKAQQTILDALGIEAENYAHAEAIFTALGIVVNHKRVGRKSVPVVSKIDQAGGAMNQFGEGEEWPGINPVDFSAITEWMEQ